MKETSNSPANTGAVSNVELRTRCKRCGRSILLKYEGQDYGPTCARKVANMQNHGQLFIAPDGVMIKNETGNLCRGCGTDISNEPDALYCSECETPVDDR